MRVAYVFDRILPATQTDSEQVLSTVSALARRGVEVDLVVPRAREPVTAERLREYYQVDGPFQVEALHGPLARFSTPRKWAHAGLAARSDAVARADILYTRNIPTLLFAATRNKPFVYETYRPWMDKYPPLRTPMRLALSRPHLAAAILHSKLACDRYAALGVEPDKLHVVFNGYDPAQFAPNLSRAAARAELGLEDRSPIAVYTGHVNATKGLDVVFSMARRCPEVTFLLVGADGSGAVSLLARRIPNVRLVPWQSFDRVVRYLWAADVLIQPPSRVPLRLVGNTVLPMKLFQYLAAGRPILAPDLPDVRELLVHDDNAVLVAPGDGERGAMELRALLADPARAERLSMTARRRAEGLTWDARAQNIERILKRALARMEH